MTNEELIAKIREEIERQLEFDGKIKTDYYIGKRDAEKELLSFLSTLESEKPLPNDLEEAAEEYLQKVKAVFLRTLEYPTAKDAFISGAKWRADHTPLPEDTVLFNKGVEEGKRLMMEEAVEIGTTDIYWEQDGDRAFPAFDPPVEDLLMPDIISQRFNDGDKVKIIIVKEDEK